MLSFNFFKLGGWQNTLRKCNLLVFAAFKATTTTVFRPLLALPHRMDRKLHALYTHFYTHFMHALLHALYARTFTNNKISKF